MPILNCWAFSSCKEIKVKWLRPDFPRLLCSLKVRRNYKTSKETVKKKKKKKRAKEKLGGSQRGEKKWGVNLTGISFSSQKSEWPECKKLITGTCPAFFFRSPHCGIVRLRYVALWGLWSTQRSRGRERCGEAPWLSSRHGTLYN